MTIFVERLQAIVTADITDATRKLKEFGAEAEKAKKEASGTATIEVEEKGAEAARAKIEAAAEPVQLSLISEADMASMVAAHDTMQTEADADPVDIKSRADLESAAKAGVEAAEAAKRAADAAGGRGGGGGFSIMGMLGGLGGALVKGSGLGLLGQAGLGIGSLLEPIKLMLGASPIHLAATGLGLAAGVGSALGGGAIMGTTSLAQAAVGMGTDMLANKQALSDIQATVKAQDALQQAIAQYGPKSTQAAAAQQALNAQVKQFQPVAQGAILAAANTWQAFNKMFKQVTGPAVAEAANLFSQLMKTGEKFLPTIGAFAAQNIRIITVALQPFFQWLQGPGLKIFIDLEEHFQKGLPNSMRAFTQGFELVAKIIDYASGQTGGFMAKIADFFTKWNNPENWGRVQNAVQSLINDWHTLTGFLSAAWQVLQAFFKVDPHTGIAMIQTMTTGLQNLANWMKTLEGTTLLKGLLDAHKQQTLDLMHAIGGLVATVGPSLIQFLTVASQVSGPFIKALGTALGPPLMALFGELGKLMQALAPILTQIVKGLSGPLTAFIDQIGKAIIPALGGLVGLAAPFGSILTLIGQIADALSPIVQTLLPPLAKAIDGLASGLMPTIAPLGAALEGVAKAIVPLLPPLTQLISTVGGAVINGITQIIKGLTPLIGPLADAFFRLVQALTPLIPIFAQLVTQFGQTLVSGFTNLLNALTPMAGVLVPVAKAFGDLVGWLLKMPVLGPMAAGFGALGLVFKGGLFSNLGGLGKDFKTLAGVVDTWKTMSGAAQRGQEFLPGLGDTNFMGRLKNVAGSAGNVASALGGIGTAVAVATPLIIMGVSSWINYLHRAHDAAVTAGKQMGQMQLQAIQQVSGGDLTKQASLQKQLTGDIQTQLDNNKQTVNDIYDAWSKMEGLSTKTGYTKAGILGLITGPIDDKQMKDATTSLGQLASQGNQYAQQLIASGVPATDSFRTALENVRASNTKLSNDQKTIQTALGLTQKQIEANTQVQNIMDTAIGNAAGITNPDAARSYGALSDKLQTLYQNLNNIQTAMDNYIGVGLGIDQANTAAYQSVNNFTQGLLQNKAGLEGTKDGALQNQASFQSMAGSLKNVFDNMVSQHKPAQDIVKDYTDIYNQIQDQLKSNPQLLQAVDNLLAKYKLTPKDITTALHMQTDQGAYATTMGNINNVQSHMNDLKKGVTIPIKAQVTMPPIPNFQSLYAAAPGTGVDKYNYAIGEYQTIIKSSRYATGGVMGFKTSGIAIVGEDGSGFPEYVIPTNPLYRKNAMKLLSQVASALAMAGGGIVNNFQGGGVVNYTGRPEYMLPPPLMGGPVTGSPPMPGRPTLNIEHAHFEDRLDMDMLLNQLDFHYQMKGN